MGEYDEFGNYIDSGVAVDDGVNWDSLDPSLYEDPSYYDDSLFSTAGSDFADTGLTDPPIGSPTQYAAPIGPQLPSGGGSTVGSVVGSALGAGTGLLTQAIQATPGTLAALSRFGVDTSQASQFYGALTGAKRPAAAKKTLFDTTNQGVTGSTLLLVGAGVLLGMVVLGRVLR